MTEQEFLKLGKGSSIRNSNKDSKVFNRIFRVIIDNGDRKTVLSWLKDLGSDDINLDGTEFRIVTGHNIDKNSPNESYQFITGDISSFQDWELSDSNW